MEYGARAPREKVTYFPKYTDLDYKSSASDFSSVLRSAECGPYEVVVEFARSNHETVASMEVIDHGRSRVAWATTPLKCANEEEAYEQLAKEVIEKSGLWEEGAFEAEMSPFDRARDIVLKLEDELAVASSRVNLPIGESMVLEEALKTLKGAIDREISWCNQRSRADRIAKQMKPPANQRCAPSPADEEKRFRQAARQQAGSHSAKHMRTATVA